MLRAGRYQISSPQHSHRQNQPTFMPSQLSQQGITHDLAILPSECHDNCGDVGCLAPMQTYTLVFLLLSHSQALFLPIFLSWQQGIVVRTLCGCYGKVTYWFLEFSYWFVYDQILKWSVKPKISTSVSFPPSIVCKRICTMVVTMN